MPATDPPGGTGLSKGDVLAGARLIEPMARGERITVWRAMRSDGEPATVHALTGAKHGREKDNFLKGARKLAVLARNRPLTGVVDIVTVVPNIPAYVAKGGTAGTMDDVTILGWGVRETIRFVRRLCRALILLHENGIAHGCLRPANVLLDDDLNPRLSDAGLLIIDDSYDGPSDMKHDYAAYAAREVRLGKKPDVRSDVFSVGRLLYFALHGEEPDEKDEDTPLLASLEHAPPGLVRIIRRCTLRSPEGRYGSIKAVIKDLEQWRDAENVGLKHPHGKEGAQEDSSSPGDSDPPSYPDRPSLRPSSDASSERSGGPSTGERQAPALPIRSYHAPAVVEDDVLTAFQVRIGWALGAVVLCAAMLHAYFTGVQSNGAIAGSVVGGVLLSLVFPPVGAPFPSRVLAALAFGAGVWFSDPTAALALRGREVLLAKGGPQQRGLAVVAFKAKDIRVFRGVDLRGVDFSQQNIAFLTFEGCQLGGAVFVAANMQGTDLGSSDITGADFTDADMTGVNVSQTKGWSEAICSEGTKMPTAWVCDEGAPYPAALLGPSDAVP